MISIEFEDVVANALIELEKNKGIKKVSALVVEQYGNAVVEDLRNKGLKAHFFVWRDIVDDTIVNNRDYYSASESGRSLSFTTNPNISYRDLIDKYRGYLSLEMLKSFICPKALSTLGIEKGKCVSDEDKILNIVDDETFILIDVDGVIIDTEQRIKLLADTIGWKNALETIDWHKHIYSSNQINGSLDILREVQKKLKKLALLTKNHSNIEASDKVSFLRENGIYIPVYSAFKGVSKIDAVPPLFYNGNALLIDDKIDNVEEWNMAGGTGVLFAEEKSKVLTIQNLEFLRKI